MLDEMKVMKRARPAVKKIAQDAVAGASLLQEPHEGQAPDLDNQVRHDVVSSSSSWVRIIKHGLCAGGAPAQLCTAASTAIWTRMLRHAWSHASFKGSPTRQKPCQTTLAAVGPNESHVIRAGEVLTGKAWVEPSCEVLCHFEPR